MCSVRYAQFGEVSPKVDVYAFGVVLFELISAKEAVVKSNKSIAEPKGLVALVCCSFVAAFSITSILIESHCFG